MAESEARRRWRERQVAQRRAVLRHDVAQGDLEGFVLVRPDGSLTDEVVHVQWMDNHPAGPDTHVTVSFADGSDVLFPFGVAVVKIRAADLAAVGAGEIRDVAPVAWGADGGRWDGG